jgi:hypothetical protein
MLSACSGASSTGRPNAPSRPRAVAPGSPSPSVPMPSEAGPSGPSASQATSRIVLKQPERGEVRQVPIPPPLVRMLREHLEEFGTADDGRLFQSERGNVIAASSYSRVWKRARELGLLPEQVASVLAARPYDLRHAGVSQWLNSGVPLRKSPRGRGTRWRCC